MSETTVLVLGAGIAGLTAATELERIGLTTVVLDKGRAPGGRMATRTIDGARYDHGAQHFGARSEAFRRQVSKWQELGVANCWFTSSRRHGDGATGGEERYVGVGGMRLIPEQIAAPLDVRTGVEIVGIETTSTGVKLHDRSGAVAAGRALILTPPLPQTDRLLRASSVRAPSSVRRVIENTGYDATLAVMARTADPSGLPDGHVSLEDETIAWVADNRHKGASDLPSITIHSTAAFAERYLESPVEQWSALLCERARQLLATRIVSATGHRWRYAQPRRTLEVGAMSLDSTVPIVVAGEAFAGARVEGAFLSGLVAAEIVASL